MPNSYYEDTSATNSTTSVAFTDTQLEYLNKAHLFVKAIKTDGSTEDFTSGFTVSVSGSTTTVDVSGLSLPATTTTIRIFRTTPVDDLLTTFTNASLLRAEELNNATKQLLFALQQERHRSCGWARGCYQGVCGCLDFLQHQPNVCASGLHQHDWCDDNLRLQQDIGIVSSATLYSERDVHRNRGWCGPTTEH